MLADSTLDSKTVISRILHTYPHNLIVELRVERIFSIDFHKKSGEEEKKPVFSSGRQHTVLYSTDMWKKLSPAALPSNYNMGFLKIALNRVLKSAAYP